MDTTEFPAYADFYSSLRQHNTLEPHKDETLTEDEVLAIGRTPTKEAPLTDAEVQAISIHRYQTLSSMFYDNQWTFRDFLTYYNNRLL